MAHMIDDKADLLKRVRRIAGQVQAIERHLEGDADCGKTLHLVAATRGAPTVCWTRSSKPMPASMWRIPI